MIIFSKGEGGICTHSRRKWFSSSPLSSSTLSGPHSPCWPQRLPSEKKKDRHWAYQKKDEHWTYHESKILVSRVLFATSRLLYHQPDLLQLPGLSCLDDDDLDLKLFLNVQDIFQGVILPLYVLFKGNRSTNINVFPDLLSHSERKCSQWLGVWSKICNWTVNDICSLVTMISIIKLKLIGWIYGVHAGQHFGRNNSRKGEM